MPYYPYYPWFLTFDTCYRTACNCWWILAWQTIVVAQILVFCTDRNVCSSSVHHLFPDGVPVEQRECRANRSQVHGSADSWGNKHWSKCRSERSQTTCFGPWRSKHSRRRIQEDSKQFHIWSYMLLCLGTFGNKCSSFVWNYEPFNR